MRAFSNTRSDFHMEKTAIIPSHQLFGTWEQQSSFCIQNIASVNTQSLEGVIRRSKKDLFMKIQRKY